MGRTLHHRCQPTRQAPARARSALENSTGALPPPGLSSQPTEGTLSTHSTDRVRCGGARPPRQRAHLGGRDVHYTCRPPLLPQLPLLDLPLPLPGAGARALSLGGQLLLALGGARRGGGRGLGCRLCPPAPGESRRRLLGGGVPAQGGAGEADAVDGPTAGGRRAVRRGGRAAEGQVVVQLGGDGAPRRPSLPSGGRPRDWRRLLRSHLLPLGFPLLQKVRGAAPGAAVAAGRHVPGGLDGESAPPAPLPPPALSRLCCCPERRGPGGAGGRDGGGERDSEKHKHPGEKQKGRCKPSRRPSNSPGSPPIPGDGSPSPPALTRSVPAARTTPPAPAQQPAPAGVPLTPRRRAARRCPPPRSRTPRLPPARRGHDDREAPSLAPGAGACAIPPTPACLPGDCVPAWGGAEAAGAHLPPGGAAARALPAPAAPGELHRLPPSRKERHGPEASRAPPLSLPFPHRGATEPKPGRKLPRWPQQWGEGGEAPPGPVRCAPRPDRAGTSPPRRGVSLPPPRHLPWAAPARERTRTPLLSTSGKTGRRGREATRPHEERNGTLPTDARSLARPPQAALPLHWQLLTGLLEPSHRGGWRRRSSVTACGGLRQIPHRPPTPAPAAQSLVKRRSSPGPDDTAGVGPPNHGAGARGSGPRAVRLPSSTAGCHQRQRKKPCVKHGLVTLRVRLSVGKERAGDTEAPVWPENEVTAAAVASAVGARRELFRQHNNFLSSAPLVSKPKILSGVPSCRRKAGKEPAFSRCCKDSMGFCHPCCKGLRSCLV